MNEYIKYIPDDNNAIDKTQELIDFCNCGRFLDKDRILSAPNIDDDIFYDYKDIVKYGGDTRCKNGL